VPLRANGRTGIFLIAGSLSNAEVAKKFVVVFAYESGVIRTSET
jgi:hypothetical protein